MRITTAQAQKRIVDSISGCQSGKQSRVYYNTAIADSTAGLDNLHSKSVVAGLLGNFQRIIDSDAGKTLMATRISDSEGFMDQLTASANYGPYVMELWPVVTAWYPDFPLKDLISVQTMDKPLAYLVFSRLLTGTEKSPGLVGEEVETPLGKRKIRGAYPTGEIYGESIPEEQMENDGESTIALLHYNPLNIQGDYLSKYKITVTGGASAGSYVAVAVVNGYISFAKESDPDVAVDNVKMEVSTGAIYITESSKEVTNLLVNYVWNLDYAKDDNIPTAKEDMELLVMEAVPRAIGMKWTVFSEYLKKSQFGTEIREDNTKRILNLLYQYQVRYILDTMYDYAKGGTTTVNIPGSTTMSVEVKSQEAMKQFKAVANVIENTSGRMEGNRIVCGKNLKIFLESLPNTLFKVEPVPSGFSGPRKIGEWGTFIVYYDPYRGDEEAWMTYRGTEWYDAAYYLGEYMPVVPTDAVALGVNVRSAFCSMEAQKYHKPNCVEKIKVKFA